MASRINTMEFTETPRARVIRTLRGWIESGVLPKGSAVPSDHDLSKRLGVSRPTVQRALTVLEGDGLLKSRSGYTRTVEGPASTGFLTGAVALVTAHTQKTLTHPHEGWIEYISFGVADALRKASLHTLIVMADRLDEAMVQHLLADRPRGIIWPDFFTGSIKPRWDLLRACGQAGIPVVVQGCVDDLYDRVISDHDAGTYDLTRFLIDRGRKRIIQVLPDWQKEAHPGELYWTRGRRTGYERAMRDAGLEPLPLVTPPVNLIQFAGSDHDVVAVQKAMAAYWAGCMLPHLTGTGKADAVLFPSDEEAVAGAMACRLIGRTPGVDLDVAGYDNYWIDEVGIDVPENRPIATVDKQNMEIGRQMVRLLMDRVEGRLPSEPQLRVVKPKLVITSGEEDSFSSTPARWNQGADR